MALLSTNVRIDDGDLIATFERLERLFSPAGRGAIFQEITRRVERIVNLDYPPQTNNPLPRRYRWSTDSKLHKFKSLAAQRGYFKALARGQITVPYRRKGTLGRSLQFKIERRDNALIMNAFIPEGTGKFKPEWVVGTPQQQTGYFRRLSNWKSLAIQVEKQTPQITEAVKVAVDTVIEDLRL